MAIKAHVIGRLGKDAEEVQVGEGRALRFSVASDRRKKDASGQWVKMTDWVTVQTYQVNLKPYLTKGKQVVVSGDLIAELWTRKDGTMSLDLAIMKADITLLGGDTQQSQQNAPTAAPQAPQQAAAPQAAQQPTRTYNVPQSGPNDELPF